MSGGVALDRVHLYSRVCAEMLRNLFLCVPLLLLAHVAAAAPVPVPDVEDGICRSETEMYRHWFRTGYRDVWWMSFEAYGPAVDGDQM